MTCDHAGCSNEATVETRFGDGTCLPFRNTRQTFVRYCDPHYQQVARMFRLCDIQLVKMGRSAYRDAA